MKSQLTLFKRIVIDLDKERKRIEKCKFTDAQRTALLKLIELFEQGKWQECLDHVNNDDSFPYNDSDEYDEREHINVEISDILHDLAIHNYYTSDQLLEEAKKKLKVT